jgi:hypothetical protein
LTINKSFLCDFLRRIARNSVNKNEKAQKRSKSGGSAFLDGKIIASCTVEAQHVNVFLCAQNKINGAQAHNACKSVKSERQNVKDKTKAFIFRTMIRFDADLKRMLDRAQKERPDATPSRIIRDALKKAWSEKAV